MISTSRKVVGGGRWDNAAINTGTGIYSAKPVSHYTVVPAQKPQGKRPLMTWDPPSQLYCCRHSLPACLIQLFFLSPFSLKINVQASLLINVEMESLASTLNGYPPILVSHKSCILWLLKKVSALAYDHYTFPLFYSTNYQLCIQPLRSQKA